MSDMEKYRVMPTEQTGSGFLPDDKTTPIIDDIVIGDPLPIDPSRSANEHAVRFYKLSYRGGHRYKFGCDADGKKVLVEHEQESQAGIDRRRRMSSFYNYCQPVVDWYISTVFTRPIQRDFSDELYAQFMINCDQMQTSLEEQLQVAMTEAMISGEHYLVVDSTLEEEVQTQAQAEAAGANLFVTGFDYTNIKATRHINNKLTECLIRISDTEARLYDYDYIYLITLKDGKVISIAEPFEHEYGTIPIVEVICNNNHNSFISDLSEANKTHFNINSILMEELSRQTWTQWIGLGLEPSELKALTAGGRKIYCVDKDAKGIKFEQLSGDTTQADSLRKSLQETVDEIYRAAGISRPDTQNKGPESGRALIVRASEVARKARQIADFAEKAERQLANIWAGGMDKEIPVEVNYPEEFHLEAMDEELARTLQIVGANLPKVLKREEVRTLGKHILQNSMEQYSEMETELETMYEKETQESPDGQRGMNNARRNQAGNQAGNQDRE